MVLEASQAYIMPIEMRQNIAVNDRIERFIEIIGQNLEARAAKMPTPQRAIFKSALRHGKGFSISAISTHALTAWADEIEQGKQVEWDTLKKYLQEYLNLAYLEPGRITQARFDEDAVRALERITTYLFNYERNVPMLRSRRYEKVASGRLIVILAIVKLAYEIGHKLPPLT